MVRGGRSAAAPQGLTRPSHGRVTWSSHNGQRAALQALGLALALAAGQVVLPRVAGQLVLPGDAADAPAGLASSGVMPIASSGAPVGSALAPDSGLPAGVPLAAPAPAPQMSEATTTDGPILQNARYWLGSPNLTGWVEGSDPCVAWQGVGCKDGRVVSLSLDALNLTGSLPPQVADLTQLQVLNMSSNNLTGALPDEWSYPAKFPNLTVLLLDSNQLQGSMPASWASSGAFPNLVLLNLGNNNLSGNLPGNWGNGGLVNLRVLSLKHNLLSGSLPATWGDGNWSLPNLAIMSLDNNLLTGPLPDDWSKGWGSLSLLSMTHNLLDGSLPPSWGGGAFPKLQIMAINNNDFSGDMPVSWTEATTFPSMRAAGSGVVLFPGNDNLTGSLPPELRYKVLKYDSGNRYVHCSYLPCKTDVALPSAPALAPGILPLAAPALAPAPLVILDTGIAVPPTASSPAAVIVPPTEGTPAAAPAAGQGQETLVATVNLAGKDLTAALSDAEKSALVNTAASEAGVDPSVVSIGQVTDLSKAAPAPPFQTSSARRLMAEASPPGVQVQLLINGTADTLKSAQTKLASSVDSGAFLSSLQKAGVKVEGMSLGSAPPRGGEASAPASPVPIPVPGPTGPSPSKSNTGAIVGGVLGGVLGALLIGGILVWCLCFRKRKNKAQAYGVTGVSKGHNLPASTVYSPAWAPSKGKDGPPPPIAVQPQSLERRLSDSKKGDPPAPSTPPRTAAAPAAPTTPQLVTENPALARALSESHSGKTNVVPYSEYRKKRLENIRKESGLEEGLPTQMTTPQRSAQPGRAPGYLMDTR